MYENANTSFYTFWQKFMSSLLALGFRYFGFQDKKNPLNTIFWTPVTQPISSILDKHFFWAIRKVCWVNLWQKARRLLAISLSEEQGQAPACLLLTSVWPSAHKAGSYLMVKTWHVKSCAHKKDCLNICVLCCWRTPIFSYLKSFILILGLVLADSRTLFCRYL